jgi:hypothetical protein
MAIGRTKPAKRAVFCLGIAMLAAAILVGGTSAQSIPPVKAKALDDSEVILPKPGSTQLLIIVIGFSHKSGPLDGAWAKRINADYASDAHVSFYEMAQLQSAPSLIRPMILHGIRGEVPAEQHSRFVPIYDHESEWKSAVNFSAPADPYVVVANADGHIVWRTHGPVSDAGYAELKTAVAKASASKQDATVGILRFAQDDRPQLARM